MKVLQTINTYNPSNGANGKLEVVQYHPSRAKRENALPARVERRQDAAIAQHNGKRNYDTELIHVAAVSDPKDAQFLSDLVMNSEYSIVEIYRQIKKGVKSMYFVMYKVIDEKKVYAVFTVDEFGRTSGTDNVTHLTLSQVRARMTAINAILTESEEKEISPVNVAQRAKPLVNLGAVELPKPAVKNDKFIVVRQSLAYELSFYDGDGAWLTDKDKAIAKRYGHKQAYKAAIEIKKSEDESYHVFHVWLNDLDELVTTCKTKHDSLAKQKSVAVANAAKSEVTSDNVTTTATGDLENVSELVTMYTDEKVEA